ncbi:MAG: hypothetical protein KF898_11105 [Parachlamydiales bacterium]|nr:hypothetical protein [Candidatus Acheromyda pituitae]
MLQIFQLPEAWLNTISATPKASLANLASSQIYSIHPYHLAAPAPSRQEKTLT